LNYRALGCPVYTRHRAIDPLSLFRVSPEKPSRKRGQEKGVAFLDEDPAFRITGLYLPAHGTLTLVPMEEPPSVVVTNPLKISKLVKVSNDPDAVVHLISQPMIAILFTDLNHLFAFLTTQTFSFPAVRSSILLYDDDLATRTPSRRESNGICY